MEITISIFTLFILLFVAVVYALVRWAVTPVKCPHCNTEMKEYFNYGTKKLEFECPCCGYCKEV